MFKPNLVRKIISRAACKQNVPEPQLEIKSMLDSKASRKNSRVLSKSSEKGNKSEAAEAAKRNSEIL